MGLIYSSADSSELMSALASNLSVARTTTSELTAGCQQLIAAIDGHTLSGVAYNAGKGLFSELVIPTIHRMTAAIDHVQSDLTKYGAANAFISSEGYLNEDKLKLQIKIMKASQKSLHEAAKQVATIAYNTPIPGIHNLLKDTQRTLIQMADSLQQDIDKIQKKLQKLNDFAMQINGLFNNSLNEMELAMQGVTVLNETTVKSNGTYTLPSGVDKSYFTEIKKDTSTVIDSEKQKIELIKPTDSIEEVSRKTIALANLGINPYTGEKINESQANRFKYAAWSGTLTEIGNVVLGSYYGNKAASRLDGLDDVGNVKRGRSSANDALTSNKHGKNYTLNRNKSTGTVTYKKANVVYGEYSTKIDSKVIEIEKANLPDGLKKTYTDNYYRTVESVDELKTYRTFGGNADAGGGFATTEPAVSRIDAKMDTALLPEWKNSRMYEAEITIPKGEKLNIGKVAPQINDKTGTVLKGGADQILLPQDWPLEWITDIRVVPSK
ncbi:T7SS effector LXG polymorphic toxin [Enterococcus faecalis]|uniref:T7SS effector LXG polymorphic toxin n=3 Tax=Enterococcaceae TaxID=81852 RepID=UPI001E317923|nr:T7SS effector LXG polymorphic toxin [Enterococcus faecalis]